MQSFMNVYTTRYFQKNNVTGILFTYTYVGMRLTCIVQPTQTQTFQLTILICFYLFHKKLHLKVLAYMVNLQTYMFPRHTRSAFNTNVYMYLYTAKIYSYTKSIKFYNTWHVVYDHPYAYNVLFTSIVVNQIVAFPYILALELTKLFYCEKFMLLLFLYYIILQELIRL